jgi:hypothetical protein
LIPTHIAGKLPHITDLEKCGFVVIKDDGYYCAGAQERWAKPVASTKKKSRSKVEGVADAVAVYCAIIKDKYKFTPEVRGKDIGIIKSLVKDVGRDKAIELLKAYVSMDDQWFKTKRHDLPTLSSSLNKVSEYLATGIQQTPIQAPVNLFARVVKD